jgi:condensin complex subunit 1
MMHLVWTKSNSDEGKGVQNHLIECYKGLFFVAPDQMSPNDAATFIARNLISLTYGSSLAELTSLEQLLCNMMKQGVVSPAVVAKLWQVYSFQKKEISKTQRRGAIIVLGMLALADPDIVAREVDTLLKIGLGQFGKVDLELARYTCIALQRLNIKHKKGISLGRFFTNYGGTFEGASSKKLPVDHPVVERLREVIHFETGLNEWYVSTAFCVTG